MGPVNPRVGRTVADSDRDRGQLFLIAAISIAFIVLGLIVAFNGIMYTGTTASGGAGESMDDVEMVEMEIEQGLKGLGDSLKDAPGNSLCNRQDSNEYNLENQVSLYFDSINNMTNLNRPANVSMVGFTSDQSVGPHTCGITVTYHYKSNDVSAKRSASKVIET